MFEILTQDLASPYITIFLTASLETLSHRIAIRGRDFEENMDANYLTYLIDAYNEYITYCREKFPDNILVIDCNNFDFVHSEYDRKNIMNKIEKKYLF
ncbi:MAG: deoxynucleoside kinase [Mycoplasmatales bacterium]